MTSYKLIYFNIRGRAEICRILFALANQKYEDVRLSVEEWPKLKETFPFHLVPVLEITDNNQTLQLAQSHSIVRYLANKFGYAGKTELEKCQADMIYEQVGDLLSGLGNIFRKKNEEEKKNDMKNALTNTIPAGLKMIQNLFEKNKTNSGFLVGSSLTYTDLALMIFYDWLLEYKEPILSKFPLLKQHEQKIRNLPVIKEHLEKNKHYKLSLLF
nr:glutathione S-transferase GSTS8-3 [Brachionus angularis]